MGFFGLFNRKQNDDYDEDEYFDNIGDFKYYNFEDQEHQSDSKAQSRPSKFVDAQEEAKLDAQLKEHITDIEMKKLYDQAIKDREAETLKSSKLEPINLSKYSKSEIQKYINSQCDIMNEATKYIDESKEEYSVVTSYFSDIQMIEAAPENIRRTITFLADKIASLTVDRRIFHTSESNISNNSYSNMERIEAEMPGALIKIQGHESYFQTVKKDLNIIEGARLSLRYEARDLVRKQTYIQRFSTISIICLFIVFAIFVIGSLVIADENNTLFLTVIILASLLAIGLFAYLKNIERQVIVTEIKLNKSTSLLNKIKVKYINSANTLDYVYTKYNIKSSYQLSKQYENYLVAKNEKKKISRLTDDLNDAEVRLENILKGLHLYDPHIWIAQVKALIDPKEMVEVRHGLSTCRQKLRTQIEYNMNRVNEVKEEIKSVTISNPEYKDEVMRILEDYERRNT